MPIQPYKKVRTEDQLLRQVQDAVELPLKDISNRRILDGQILSDIELTTAVDNTVLHKLQRNITGWIIIRQDTNTTVWEMPNTRPQDSLILRCGANCKISLWVF